MAVFHSFLFYVTALLASCHYVVQGFHAAVWPSRRISWSFSSSSSPWKASNTFVESAAAAAASSSASFSVTAAAKEQLLQVCRRLKEENGLFLVDSNAKKELQQAVSQLEALAEPYLSDSYVATLVGNWTLLCTTSTTDEGIDTTKVPEFFRQGPLEKIRESIRRTLNDYLEVQQQIRSTNEDGTIDRIDHVLEYRPPKQLRDVLDNLPEQLNKVNINPLSVSKSKLILIHKATVESTVPLTTKLALQSIVLNVAGTSNVLDPKGKDILGLNFPLGEFLNSGTFETTYMDDTMRISRGKRGLVDQLRVFVRQGTEDAIPKRDVQVMDVDMDPEFSERSDDPVASAAPEEDDDDVGAGSSDQPSDVEPDSD